VEALATEPMGALSRQERLQLATQGVRKWKDISWNSFLFIVQVPAQCKVHGLYLEAEILPV
jgi:hypothetical protein